MSDLPFSATTPIHVARVGLRARDGEALAAYYKRLLGLTETRRSGATIGLGAKGRELLEIEHAPLAKPDDPRSAGLFHTAFLLPRREDLARWLRHAMENGIRITGASDHHVSEAIYLDDPEGNGIEIYADRPREDWVREGGQIAMTTERLDVESLLATLGSNDSGWQGAPEGSVIGHVHLRAGDVAAAENWWNALGLETMVHYGSQAVFLASGGYHHHIGANIWQSRDARPREADRAGLSFVEMVAAGAREERVLSDPWRTEIRIVPGHA